MDFSIEFHAGRTLNLGWVESSVPTASMTGGLVQEFEHQVLPSIGPKTTFVCTLLASLVSTFPLSRMPKRPGPAGDP